MSSPTEESKCCRDCNGSGVDRAKTALARRRGETDKLGYVRCWSCNGNGADPAEYFRWTEFS